MKGNKIMERKIIKLENGNEYEFINESWETSNAWGHKTVVFKNGNPYNIAENKIRYYNRTWECYRYQSCMKGAIYNLKRNELQRYIDRYKYVNNITKFKRGEKAKLIADFEQTEIAKELAELLKNL